MKNFLLSITTAALLSSCSVQQFSVNTSVKPFEYGGRVFGERTKGKEVKKSADLFLFGINLTTPDVDKMAKEINANSYTIETKRNFISFALYYFTVTAIDWKVIKVIKRDEKK